MKTRRLYTWQFFVGVFIGGFVCFILGVILATFVYMKNIDLGGIRKNQAYLIQEVDELNKERREIMYILGEKELIEDWNDKAITKPEEGK